MRVMFNIVEMRLTPAPSSGSPTGYATAPSSSSSAVGSARVPSFSLRRRTVMAFGPSSRCRWTRKRASPLDPSGAPSGRASVRAISDVVALVNHLVPYRRHVPDPSLLATVPVRDTSDPPAVSVIHCPLVQAVAGSRVVRWPTTAMSSRSPCNNSVRAAPSVMATGQL